MASTLTMTATKNDFFYDSASNRTYFRVKFNWSWSSTPAVLNTDIVAASWSPDMYQDTATTYTYSKVKYKNRTTGSTYERSSNVEVGTPGRGAYTKFDMGRNVSTQPLDYDWAYNGYGYIGCSKSGVVPEAAMKIAYGHETLGLSPGVSFPAGATINFSFNVNELNYGYVHAK